jgi:hypothetical protein
MMSVDSNELIESAAFCLKFSNAGLGFKKYAACFKKSDKLIWIEFVACLEKFLKIRNSYYIYSESVCDFLTRSVILPYKMTTIQISKVVKKQIESAIEEINKKQKIVFNNEDLNIKISNLKSVLKTNAEPESRSDEVEVIISSEKENYLLLKKKELSDIMTKIKIQISDYSNELRSLETNNYLETEYADMIQDQGSINETMESSNIKEEGYLEEVFNQYKLGEKSYEEKVKELEDSKKKVGMFFFFYDDRSYNVRNVIEILKSEFSLLNFRYEPIPSVHIESKGMINSVSNFFSKNTDTEYQLDHTYDLVKREAKSDSRNFIIYIFDKSNLKKSSYIKYSSPHNYFDSFPTTNIIYLHNNKPIGENKKIDISSWLNTCNHTISYKDKNIFIPSILNMFSVHIPQEIIKEVNEKNDNVLVSLQNLEEFRERYYTLQKYEKKYDEDKEKCTQILNELKEENFLAIEKEIKDKKEKIFDIKEKLNNLNESFFQYEKEIEYYDDELKSIWKSQNSNLNKSRINNSKQSKENENIKKSYEDLIKDLESLTIYSHQFSIRLNKLEFYLRNLIENLKTFLTTENKQILENEFKKAEEFKKIDEEEISKHKYNLNY